MNWEIKEIHTYNQYKELQYNDKILFGSFKKSAIMLSKQVGGMILSYKHTKFMFPDMF